MSTDLNPISILKNEYQIDTILAISKPENGHSQKVRLITTPKGKFVIDFFDKTKLNFARISFVCELLKNNFHTPAIIKTIEGNNYVECDNHCILLTKFIEGTHPGLDERQVINNAQLLAQFHSISANHDIPPDRGTNNLEWIHKKVGENVEEIQKKYGRKFQYDYELMLSFAEKPRNGSNITGVAHNDFKSDNILVSTSGEHYLIDMFNMATDELIADVAKYIKSEFLNIEDPNQQKHFIELFLQEYLIHHPKMKKDIKSLKKWLNYWLSVTFFFFICQFDQVQTADSLTFKEAKHAVSNVKTIDSLNLD